MNSIRKGILKRIHMNGALLRRAKKGERGIRPISIQNCDGLKTAKRIKVDGPSELIFNPNHPLKSGAILWIETKAEVQYE